MGFLAAESALNLFIIGDIENNGFESEFQQLWGDFDGRGRLRAVLLRYFGSFIPYAPGDFDLEGLAGILRRQRDRMQAFSGIDRVVRRFEGVPGLFPEGIEKRTLCFVELKSGQRLDAMTREVPSRIERAVPEDAPGILELQREIEEFRVGEDGQQVSRRELEQGAARAYLVRDGGRVIAAVRTTAENSRSAMIVGVATHPDYRRRGLATQLLVRLGRELLAEGKRPCLFYDNPQAGGIYRRLGFTDVGTWVMYLPAK